MSRLPTAVTITDPLIKYQTLVASGLYSPDLSQHRLAHHLQKVYLRLKDYTPAPEYQSRLQQISRAVKGENGNGDRSKSVDSSDDLAVPSHPIWRNPLFARLLQKSGNRHDLALTRVLTSHQAALHVNSPKGLFLSGEVGTGKSMLLDLLAEGLPTSGKKRWHFNTFMLYAFSRLEQFRKEYSQLEKGHQEYSLLRLSKEMVDKSPILFLDEFQLPDRAASKIMNNLFIAFFQLGGVLVASSNRMPEELEKATGAQYAPPVTGGLFEQVLGIGRRRSRGEIFGQTSDFSAFLEVLKARCDFWHMEGAKDWRRKEIGSVASSHDAVSKTSEDAAAGSPVLTLKGDADAMAAVVPEPVLQKPALYFLPKDGEESWTTALSLAMGAKPESLDALQPLAVIVYGRKVVVPRQKDGVCYWDFKDLVHMLGPADYITLASNFHTFIIDGVPPLSISMKNEARRFITLLDALYEARCKLIVRAEATPDNLFFPETRRTAPNLGSETGRAVSGQDELDDATYAEVVAEVFQDQTSPFRPNISIYTDSPNAKYKSDQDSDFGPDPQARIDFGNTGAFTGEDERFAYKRASSRLWELCSEHWHARNGDWWQPLSPEARHWESSTLPTQFSEQAPMTSPSEITMGPSTELEEPVGLERFRIQHLRDTERR